MCASRWIVAALCAVSALLAAGAPGRTHADILPLTVCGGGCPYAQIQPALDAAPVGAEIDVLPGSYAGNLSVSKDVSLVGAGKARTIIHSGSPVVSIAPGPTVTISDLTITGGTYGQGSPGGILSQGNLTLTNVVVSDNGGVVGGISAAPSGSMTLTNVTVSENHGLEAGGILVGSGATLTGTGLIITGNQSNTSGGGITNQSQLNLTDSTIILNSSADGGGGLYNAGRATLSGVTILGNTAFSRGGGIDNHGDLTSTNSSVMGNTAVANLNIDYPGGGIYNAPPGTLSLSTTPVTGNTPDDCDGCAATAPGPGSPRLPVRADPFVSAGPSGGSAGFFVTFPSTQAGQGYVLFGPGPGCAGLVGLATQDAGTGTTYHGVKVTGDEMNLMAGAVLPGATYSYEVETVTRTGVEIDTNGGTCYSVTLLSQ